MPSTRSRSSVTTRSLRRCSPGAERDLDARREVHRDRIDGLERQIFDLADELGRETIRVCKARDDDIGCDFGTRRGCDVCGDVDEKDRIVLLRERERRLEAREHLVPSDAAPSWVLSLPVVLTSSASPDASSPEEPSPAAASPSPSSGVAAHRLSPHHVDVVSGTAAICRSCAIVAGRCRTVLFRRGIVLRLPRRRYDVPFGIDGHGK